ncbi:hsp90-like protein [Lasiosphaeris hirsuta]|uniref:histidine kinase n=1 Tax=Lasiosphaeris hirsuta TaxID=260670 RepID=A0AA40DL37_9PEZI|nr:hsp90-like protein [Lasiosphaeris hirsuta]
MTGGTESGRGSEPLRNPASDIQDLHKKKTIAFQQDLQREHRDQRQTAPPAQESASIHPGRDEAEHHPQEVTPGRRSDEDEGQARTGTTPDTDAGEAQRQLSQYREDLARQMERRDSSVRGGQTAGPGPGPFRPGSEPTTASTESGNTVRGGTTPGLVARTPSYPFPRMTSPAYLPQQFHQPFTTLSPTTAPARPPQRPLETAPSQDSIVSNPSTPASGMTFLPAGHTTVGGPHDYPTPSLYDLTLMLNAVPGLDPWWHAVVQIMTEDYRAERVTLAIPADSTDIENVPWGQKATYSARREDDLSLGYLARGSSLIPSSNNDETPDSAPQAGESPQQEQPARPGLQSRHSFTSYEDRMDRKVTMDRTPQSLRRPNMPRSKTTHPTVAPVSGEDATAASNLNREALEEHDAMDEPQNIPSWEVPFSSQREGQGKVLDVLQALDYEADPLIDHNGVVRVLERGRVVALTRTYPYLGQASVENKAPDTKPAAEKRSGGIGSLLDEDHPRPTTPRYEEYEQAPPSPWSQSPAPSPAMRADPSENPFFTDAMVDEESFNPSTAAPDYAALGPPAAIGIDNSWTVLHIPLTHVLLSKPNPAFKLDAAFLEQKMFPRSKTGDTATVLNHAEPTPKEKHAPIAILSILSPIIPYPSNLRHSLEHLAPHLATSFSLARHYTNLEIELNGLQKRRPATAGFGAIGPDGRPLADPTALASLGYFPAEDVVSRGSMGGSITSPSDYSHPSRSAAGSPAGTPNWDPSALGLVMEKRVTSSSPLPVGGDSYFNTKPRSAAGSGGQRTRRNSRESSTAEKRSSLRLSGGKGQWQDSTILSPSGPEISSSAEPIRRSLDELPVVANSQQKRTPSKEQAPKLGAALASSQHRHTQLHSYGADFASTFQSLPPSSSIGKGVPQAVPSRSGSISQEKMTPPSDKLKGLILDSLPAHVFVALPQTGEIVWVNSRFLSYRGQTSADLAADPWGSIHPDDRDEYLRTWGLSVRTGEQFSRTVRIRRFDGAYRWFYARAVASKDKRGVILQFLGSYMDIHDQHIAELRAARQEEIEASEAKHRLLANLIPQIIFTATEDEGITFANEQWLSYTGQSFEDVLGLGFMDFVHPDDLAKCRVPIDRPPTPVPRGERKGHEPSNSVGKAPPSVGENTSGNADSNIRGIHQALSRNNSSSTGSVYELPTANLTELARKGVIRVSTDSNGRLSYTTEIRLRSKSGEYRWHLIRCVEIDNVDFGNGVSSFFGSATDINDLKLLETKLKEAMESKGRFLSNMSHEIRTPLIGISGMVSFLQDTALNEEQRDYTNTIQTSANSLLMIINDILDLSKVDAGMMKLNHEWFHTRSLIEDVNELVSTMAIAKRLELNYVVEEDVPAWVKGDKVRIRQVLLNVIGNAIKFTSQGEVFSRCRIIMPKDGQLEENEIMLEFSIIDTGRGFTQEEADLIFKPFSQIDGSSTRQHGGSGLGLVISRQLAELHGGHMEGSAIPGKGSTFTFTAKFGLPTEVDRPDLAASTPHPTPGFVRDSPLSVAGGQVPHPALPMGMLLRKTPTESPSNIDPGFRSPAVASSGSSELSGNSLRTQVTERSSMSSVNFGLVRFSEAARASGQDLSQMKLEMPSGRSSPGTTPRPGDENHPATPDVTDFRPPMYSILIICPQMHSREATTKHIEMTLPKDIPHQITGLGTVQEAQRLIGGDDPVLFTHVVVNLPEPEEIINLMGEIMRSNMVGKVVILILSDSVQRQAVMKMAAGTRYEDMLSESRVTYIYKPVKPSRFAVIFDPAKERDLSIDRNRSTAQRLVEHQKQSYLDMERRMGNKGYNVLLVEDNPVNQKVLQKYLRKVGVAVELAADGVECTERVFSKDHGYYSLILCDLHMPRKDGYQACREIRNWEAREGHTAIPIVALSANVMSDVQEKCVAAGFNDYVTKPVDFIDLSNALSKFF